MCAYCFPAMKHSQNRYHVLIFSSSPLHVQYMYSAVDRSLFFFFSFITVEFNLFPNQSPSVPALLQCYVETNDAG